MIPQTKQLDSDKILHIKANKKINLFEEIEDLQNEFSQEKKEEEFELSQNKMEKRSFYNSLMKLKQKIPEASTPSQEEPSNLRKRILLK